MRYFTWKLELVSSILWVIVGQKFKETKEPFWRTLRVFHFFVFSFLLVFVSLFFRFLMLSFLQKFLLLIVFAHSTVSSLFVRYLVFVLLLQVLRIWESVFYLALFPAFNKASLGLAVLSSRLQSFPLRSEV